MAAPKAPDTSADTINVYNPYGDKETIPKSSLNQALQVGYKVPSPEEVHHYFKQQELEGQGGQAMAAAAARGVTLGASDPFLTSTGITTPEHLKELREAHPIKSAATEVGANLASLALMPGGAALKGAKAAYTTARAGGEAAEIAKAGSALAEAKNAFTAKDIFNPVGAVSKLGAQVGEGVASRATGLGQVGANIAGLASRGAVEGGIYGAGQSLTEHAMGDPDALGEKLVANIGHGVLLGGGIGTAFGGLEAVVPPAVGAARNSLAKVKNSLLGADESGVGPLGNLYAKTSSFVSGKPEETILDAIRNRDTLFQSPSEKVEMAQNFSKSLEDHYQQMNKASYASTQSLKPQELQSALYGVAKEPAQEMFLNKMSSIEDAIKTIRSEADLYPQGIGRRLEIIKDRIANKVSSESSAFDVFNALEEAKNTIRKDIKFGKFPSSSEIEAQNLLKGLSNEFKTSLENETVWGPAAATQHAYNESLNDLLHNKNMFQKEFMMKVPTKSGGVAFKINPGKVNSFFAQIDKPQGIQKAEILQSYLDSSGQYLKQVEDLHSKFPVDNIRPQELKKLLEKNQDVTSRTLKQAEMNKTLGHLEGGAHNTYIGEGMAGMAALHSPILGAGIEAFNMLRSPGIAIQRLARINAMAEKVSASIDRGAKAIFKGAIETGKNTSGFIGSKLISKDERSNRDDKNMKMVAMINKLSNDPEKLVNHLGNATKDIYHAAPDTAAATQGAISRGMQYLKSAAPETKSPFPLGDDPIPSKEEMGIFAERVHVINNPISILDELKNGTLVPAHIEAVGEVYPKLLQEMQTSVLSSLADAKAKKHLIPQRTKNMLSLFLNQDLDASITPMAVMQNQMMMQKIHQQAQAQDQQMMGNVKPTQKGLGGLERNTQSMTAMQKSSQRIDQS